jgi:hypothetical protein
MWWKWWRVEPSRIQVPAEIEVAGVTTCENSNLPLEQTKKTSSPSGITAATGSWDSSSALVVRQLGLPVLKSQGAGLNHHVEKLVNSYTLPNPPRRSPERTIKAPAQTTVASTPVIPPQNRSLRRRYQDVLSRMPFMSFKPAQASPAPPGPASEIQQSSTPAWTAVAPGKYTVQISPIAASRGSPRNRTTYSIMSEEDRQWIQRAQEPRKQPNPKHKSA